MPGTPRRGERGKHSGSKPVPGQETGFAPRSLPRPDAPPARNQPGAPRPALPTSAEELPQLGPGFWDIIDAGLSSFGLALTPGSRRAVDLHVRLLLAWNASINLTALRGPEQIARGHVLDSLSAVPLLRDLGATGRMVDLGSGGGYPGLPLAAALPASECFLVDSVRKKASFLAVAAAAVSSALRTAGEATPSLRAHAERAEELARRPEQRERSQLVLARALGSLAEVAELGLPLLAADGYLVAWKRDAADGTLRHELRAAQPLLRAAGAARPEVRTVAASSDVGLADHVLVVVRKIRPTPARFPRLPAERRRALLT